jgi:cytochrome c oxidase cbb3-type subunit III
LKQSALSFFMALQNVSSQVLHLLLCIFLFSGSLFSAQIERPSPKSNVAPPDLPAGKRMFERHCALCHGIDGKGGRGPNLNRAELFHAPDDTALNSVISDGIPPEMPAGWFFSEEEVANIAVYVRSLGKIPAEPVRGDPTRGAIVFSAKGCATCHLFATAGLPYGPDLTDVASRRSAAYVRGAIIAPAEHLPEGFMYVRATTASGKIIEGIRANEDTFSVQIKDATGNFHSFRKEELKDLQKLRGQTPMPSFKTILTPAELENLVAYLFSVKAPQ